MESSFGIADVWLQGDWVTRSVAIVLLAMSLASWIVIALKALALRRLGAQRRGCDNFWHSGSFEQGLQQLEGDGNPWREIALRGRDATQHLQQGGGQLHDQLDLSDWVERSLQHAIDDCAARLQSGLSLLASVGSTAPFVGLFGTVWGIYHALLGLGAVEQASIAQVAGPIGEALVMTAFGLVVAIPAVLGYNALVRANKGELHRIRRFAHELHGYFVTGARIVRAQA